MTIDLTKEQWEEVLSLVRYGLEAIADRYTVTATERQAADALGIAYRNAVKNPDAETSMNSIPDEGA